MDHRNKTTVTEFILLGFQNEKEVEFLLLFVFLLMYTTSLIGNTVIILLCCDYRLHSHMYFFVAKLSFLEVTVMSTVVPKMLANTFSLTKTISFEGCLTQSFFYFLLGSTEFFILAVMSFDRYVALCNPLRYGHHHEQADMYNVAAGILCGCICVNFTFIHFNCPSTLLRAKRNQSLLL